MRLTPFALLALTALPACQPYGYGYGAAYGDPAYGAPAPVYGSPYYPAPAYAPPPAYAPAPAEGLFLFGGDRDDRRRYDRGDDRRQFRGGDDRFERSRAQGGPQRGAPPQPQQRQAPQVQVPQGGNRGGHDPSFNPANPGAHNDR